MNQKELIKNCYLRVVRVVPDIEIINKLLLKTKFKATTGKTLSFSKPENLNQKLQWVKIYDRNPLYTVIADKVGVRKYLTDMGLQEVLIPCFGEGSSFEEFNLSNINSSSFPVIIKVNHDCSGGLILRNPNESLINVKGISEPKFSESDFNSTYDYNEAYIRYFIKERMKYNHYYSSKEWQYKNIPKKFLIEKLLEDSDGHIPNDYKFHCFNGKVEFIYVSVDREGDDYRKIYYPDWTPAPFTWTKIGKEKCFEGDDISPPENLNKLIEVAEKISQDFKYIRVDLYSTGKEMFFGELTLQHGSGFEPILPAKYDEYYGSLFDINNK
ncbi:ATP-grasp fold amidoligase family protein [Vibrio parahaemolyticus]